MDVCESRGGYLSVIFPSPASSEEEHCLKIIVIIMIMIITMMIIITIIFPSPNSAEEEEKSATACDGDIKTYAHSQHAEYISYA